MRQVSYIMPFMKEKDLVAGRVYVIKDGRLLLYLGKSVRGLYIFYAIVSAYLIEKNSSTTFGNYEIQVQGLAAIANKSLNNPGEVEALLEYKGIPSIHGEFPFVNFENTYKKWYTISFSNMFSNKNITVPELASISNRAINTGFVSSKDLVPGELYYSGQCWRSTYVYIGRNSLGEYLWYFVSNEETLKHSSIQYILSDITKTKHNKKVKRLADAVNDKSAFVCKETLDLIKINYKVNINGITQQMLDRC